VMCAAAAPANDTSAPAAATGMHVKTACAARVCPFRRRLQPRQRCPLRPLCLALVLAPPLPLPLPCLQRLRLPCSHLPLLFQAVPQLLP